MNSFSFVSGTEAGGETEAEEWAAGGTEAEGCSVGGTESGGGAAGGFAVVVSWCVVLGGDENLGADAVEVSSYLIKD